MANSAYEEWYDNGPGSESFKRKYRQDEVKYAQSKMDELNRLKIIESRHSELLELVKNLIKCTDRNREVYSFKYGEFKDIDSIAVACHGAAKKLCEAETALRKAMEEKK